MALMEYMIIWWMKENKRKERMRDVMDDGICQNQRVLSVLDVSCKLCSPRFCSLKSLYIGFHWTLGFICHLPLSFKYFYKIDQNWLLTLTSWPELTSWPVWLSYQTLTRGAENSLSRIRVSLMKDWPQPRMEAHA